jgi:integrase
MAMSDVFKIAGRDGNRLACWYGKVKVGPGKRNRVKLFSDKTSSQRRLTELQKEADRRAAGIDTADTDRLQLGIKELAERYYASLKGEKRDDEHRRITRWMTDKLIELGEWRFYRDITRDSLEKIVAKLEAQGATASYQNKFIVRAKALVHWALPDGWPDPLKKVRRVKEKGAKKTRGRRAGSDAEVIKFFASAMPDHRKLAYALAAFNGLRRNECQSLKGAHVHTDATIPFLGLPQKQGHDDVLDYIPLHPYVLKLLEGRLLMPGALVLPSVPDMKTMEKDLTRGGIVMVDANDDRLDYHALRHTFQTNLDRTGCSRATKKKLMRHAKGDVTDGYAHAELAEMLAALSKLPSPNAPVALPALKTGTTDQPVGAAAVSENCGTADHQLDQRAVSHRPAMAIIGGEENGASVSCGDAQVSYDEAIGVDRRHVACTDYDKSHNLIIDSVLGPSTQVD